MKALVLTAPNRLEYLDVPTPRPGPGEVLVAVKACGICGSDVHGMDGSTGRRQPPVIMGHEAAGVVAAAGPDVRGWEPGDRVTFDSTLYCGTCGFCRAGRPNLCDRRRVLGVSCDAYRQDGGFADYVVVPQRVLVRLPDGLTFEHAALVEPLSVAVHAVGRSEVALGDSAAVVGAGVIGLLAVQTLRAAGCGHVLAVEPDARRRALACQLGADAALSPEEADVPEAVRQATGGKGADLAVEACGVPETLGLAVDSVRKGGRVTLVGNLSPTAALPLQAVVTRELGLSGSCASCGEVPACLDLLARGVVRADPLISAVAPLCEGAAWFARLRDGTAGLLKVILRPSPEGGDTSFDP